MINQGYIQSNVDHTLSIKKQNEIIYIFFAYINDMIVISNDEEEIRKLKRRLALEFELKDLAKHWHVINKRKYTIDLLKKTKIMVWAYFYSD